MTSLGHSSPAPTRVTGASRGRSLIAVLALGAAGVLLVCATVVFVPRHKEAPPAPGQVERATDAGLDFTIRSGQGLVDHIGYDQAIAVAERFSLQVRDGGRAISYAQALDPRIDRLGVDVIVHPGDRFDLNGPPAAWRYDPAPPRGSEVR